MPHHRFEPDLPLNSNCVFPQICSPRSAPRAPFGSSASPPSMATEQELLRMILGKLQDLLHNQQELMELQNRRFQLMIEVLKRKQEEENKDLEDTEPVKEGLMSESVPLESTPIVSDLDIGVSSEVSYEYQHQSVMTVPTVDLQIGHLGFLEKKTNGLSSKLLVGKWSCGTVFFLALADGKLLLKRFWQCAHYVFAIMLQLKLFGWWPCIPPEPPPRSPEAPSIDEADIIIALLYYMEEPHPENMYVIMLLNPDLLKRIQEKILLHTQQQKQQQIWLQQLISKSWLRSVRALLYFGTK